MTVPWITNIIKYLRKHFGITAHRVAVRAHYPWYWRAVAITIVLSVSLASARWIYDAGRRIAGYDSSASIQTIEALTAQLEASTSELADARIALSAAESNLKVEKAAEQKLADRAKELEAENAALKQDLAFFEGLLPDNIASTGDPGVRINRFRVERDGAAGQYRYRLLIVNNLSRQQKDLRGELKFFLSVQQQGKDAIITVPADEKSDAAAAYRFEVRHFQRSEGVLPVPAGAVLKSVEVRVIQNGVVRARQSLTL